MIFFFNQFEYDVLAIEFLKILKITFYKCNYQFFLFFLFPLICTSVQLASFNFIYVSPRYGLASASIQCFLCSR